MRYAHVWAAADHLTGCEKSCINELNEAMHLLPQSFGFQATYSSSQGSLSEQRHSSSQSLFGSFRKACRTSSRGRLFRFGQPDLHP